MKKTIIYTSVITIAVLGACCKKAPKDPCTFSNEFTEITVPLTVQGGTVISPFVNLVPSGVYLDSLFGQNVPSTVETQVNNNGDFMTCQTSKINVNNLRLEIQAPANQNFDFVDSLNLFLRRKDGSGKILVGSKGSITAGTKSIILNIIPNVDIKDYVIKDSFGFVVGARKSANPVANTVDSTFLRFDADFKAKVFTN
jgi:hypothetical protein